jgi:uncharacterized protein YbjQ (UPF0145 family)
MKKNISMLLIAASVLLQTACASTAVTIVGQQMARPVVPAQEVRIYRTASQVPGEYQEIALLNSSAPTGWTNEEAMFKSMRQEAGKVGANAIILEAITEPSAGAKVAGALIGVAAERKGKAIAIYVKP